MTGKIIAIITVAAAFLLGIVLQTTNPASIGPVGLLAVFFLLYIVCLGLCAFLLVAGSRFLQLAAKYIASKRPVQQISVRRAYYYSTILAFGPTMAIGLRSIGSLGGYEVILILLFLVVGVLYISKRQS